MKRILRSLALLLVLVGTSAGATGAAEKAPVARWSDPGTWGGHVPAEGEVVTIPSGKSVLLDVSPPPLAGLRVDGALTFDEQDLELKAGWIIVNGQFEIGTHARPFRHHATITLLGRHPGEDVMGMGEKVLGVMGGSLDLHGEDRGPSWTRLAATAAAGADRITLERAVDWRPGDRIVVASTDFDPTQAEERGITAVAGQGVTLDKPLAFTHWGEDQTYGAASLNERAEVGLLSRNVVVRGDDASVNDGIGGHVMVMGGTARIEGVELAHMGQKHRLARYPIHFHLLGDAPGAYVRNSSIHHSFNRCLTIHGTNQVVVQDNVAYDTLGHCYFLEDGGETGNRIEGNLGLLTRAPEEGQRVLPSDQTPATFWITNPDNVVRGNAAAGSEGSGFWYALPEHPTGLSRTAQTDQTAWPRRTPLLAFAGNVAHSNGVRGLTVDDGPKPDGTTEDVYYDPHANPIPPGANGSDSPPAIAVFADLTAYKNRERGVWLRGANLRLVDAALADNAVGATFAASETFVEDSLIVGETANVGTPGEGEPTGLDGRSLPDPQQADFPIRGFEFYDGRVGARGVSFAGFHPNSQRQASGLGFNLANPYPLDPRNFTADLTWLDDSNRVFLENALPENDGDKTALFLDATGAVSGHPGGSVVGHQPFLVDGSCTGVAAWNGYVCDARYDELLIENADPTPRPIGPVVLSRADGVALTLVGIPEATEGTPSSAFNASLLADAAYAVRFGATPDRLRVSLFARAPGEWVRLSLPSAGAHAFVYPSGNDTPASALTPVASLEQLDASQGGVFFDGQTLHVKLMASPDGSAISIDVCRNAGCA